MMPQFTSPDERGLIKMADVRDVARYILRKHAPMSAMKLQKLVYYAQGWHLAYEGEPLFESRIVGARAMSSAARRASSFC
jgi:hypothetical protein